MQDMSRDSSYFLYSLIFPSPFLTSNKYLIVVYSFFSGKQSHILDLYPDFELIKVNKYGNFIQRLTNTLGYLKIK